MAGGVVFTGVILGGILLKGSIPTGLFIGVGALASVIAGLWSGLTAPVVTAVVDYGGWRATMIYNILVIAIFILTMIGLIEVFTNKGDV